VASPTWSSTEQVVRPATKRFHVRLETSGDVLSTVDMVVQRRDGPRWLRELDDDNDDDDDTLWTLFRGLNWLIF